MRRIILPWIVLTALAHSAAGDELPGLLFHLSFDRQTVAADFAAGDGRAPGAADAPGWGFAPGVRGSGLAVRGLQRCTFPLAKNFDTRRGTFSCWVKPLNWDGHSKKFRHLLVASAGPQYTLLVYLYPIGDEAVFNYINVGSGTPTEATWRAGGPVDILRRERWTHLVTTWDAQAVRLYANGQRVGEGRVAAPLPHLESGTFTICPVDFWRNKEWGDPQEQTVCDEVRIYDRVLADDEILDLYAADSPDAVPRPDPTLAMELTPNYAAKTLTIRVRPAHLNPAWKSRLSAGAQLTVIVRDPQGRNCFSHSSTAAAAFKSARASVPDRQFIANLPAWHDGTYVAEAQLSGDGQTLQGRAALTKPPTPWLPAQRDWRASKVLPPWTPLTRHEGPNQSHQIRSWNGEATLAGPFLTQLNVRSQPVLAGPIRIVASPAATWGEARVTEELPHRITLSGTGRIGDFAATYQTLMEFDGLLRTDLTLTPPPAGVELTSLVLEIPLRPEVARYYRNPVCRPWDGQKLDEAEFLPYAWLGNEERGLSWFMESAANWCRAAGAPAMSLRREPDAVVVRLHIIGRGVRVTKPLMYTFGFEATPVRPLPAQLYDWRFGSGAPIRGSNLFVYGWEQQISALNGRLLAHDPAQQRKLVDGWRAQGQETLSYTCAQCTAGSSAEYAFFADEWNQPYGATFSGYKRVPDQAPYSMVPVCPASSFSDFLVWCAQEHLRNDWGGGIYTDIDGAMPCDNAAHGCGYIDAFGQSGRSWPLYAHRGLSRRIYEACHAAGKLYFSHQHSQWFSLFNAFNDGWCPGEQFSSAVVGQPTFYMDRMSDPVWRSEFYSPTTGVATFLLPELGRLGDEAALKERGPTESCLAAALAYGVPLWIGGVNPRVVEEVWDAQRAFGMRGAEFVPFWQQREVSCSDPELRVSLWRKQGGQYLLAVTNFTDRERTAELTLRAPHQQVLFRAAWQADRLVVAGDAARLTVPAKRGALVVVERRAVQ